MPDINDVLAGEAAISQDTLDFKNWMMQRPNKNDNMDILKSLRCYADYLEQKNPAISTLNKDEQLYALRKVMSIGVSIDDLNSILPADKIPNDLDQCGEIARSLNFVADRVWRNTSFTDLKAGRISDEGAMAEYMARLVSAEKASQNAPAKETTKVAAQQNAPAKETTKAAPSQAIDPKLKAFLSRTIGSDAMAGALTAKYGEKAYAVALSAVMEPGNMVTDLGVKIDGKFSSKNLLATLAKDETKPDQAKLNNFLDNYSTRKAKAAAASKTAETTAQEAKPDEVYGVRAPATGAKTDEPSLSVMLDELTVMGKASKKKEPDLSIPTAKKPDLSQIKMTPVKTPAEQKYDELLAAKRKKSGDEKAYLTCGDLLDAGVDVQKDFMPALRALAINRREVPNEMYAAFADRDAVITKDVATAALAVMQARKTDKQLYAQFQDMAKQSRNSDVKDSERLHKDLQRQEELAMAQGRLKDRVPKDNESGARFDAALAARENKGKETASQTVDVTLVAQKEQGR